MNIKTKERMMKKRCVQSIKQLGGKVRVQKVLGVSACLERTYGIEIPEAMEIVYEAVDGAQISDITLLSVKEYSDHMSFARYNSFDDEYFVIAVSKNGTEYAITKENPQNVYELKDGNVVEAGEYDNWLCKLLSDKNSKGAI